MYMPGDRVPAIIYHCVRFLANETLHFIHLEALSMDHVLYGHRPGEADKELSEHAKIRGLSGFSLSPPKRFPSTIDLYRLLRHTI